MQPLRLCTFVAFIAVLQAYGTSKKVLDFFSYVVGDYDNKEQTQKAGDDHAFIQVRLIPVDIKCLRPDPVLYLEEGVNGVTRVIALAVIKDGIEDTVSEIVYNFTDHTKYKPGDYNVDNLSNISCGDLQEAEDCIGSFEVSSEGFVFGNFPHCSVTVNGTHPRFTAMFTCDSHSVTMPVDSDQVSPIEPYELRPIRKKYPVINPPEGYVSPCGN